MAEPERVRPEEVNKKLKDGSVLLICAYNYVIGYDDWKRRFAAGPLFGGCR